jgi:hypothetical protein
VTRGRFSPPARPAFDGLVTHSFLDCGHAEPDEAAPVPGRVPEAVRRAAEHGPVHPATSPEYSVGGHGNAWRVGDRRRGIMFFIVPIGTPFRDISDHVRETPPVGIQRADRGSVKIPIIALDTNVSREPFLERCVRYVGNGCQAFRIVGVEIERRRAGPAGKFPLRFGREPIRPTFLLA